MASILEVTRDTLAKWETCATLPNLKNVFYFAKYFSLSIDYVLGLSRDRTKAEYKEYNSHVNRSKSCHHCPLWIRKKQSKS